jgi:hypothetical protein
MEGLYLISEEDPAFRSAYISCRFFHGYAQCRERTRLGVSLHGVPSDGLDARVHQFRHKTRVDHDYLGPLRLGRNGRQPHRQRPSIGARGTHDAVASTVPSRQEVGMKLREYTTVLVTTSEAPGGDNDGKKKDADAVLPSLYGGRSCFVQLAS